MEKKVIIGNVCFIKDLKNDHVLFLKRNREPMKDLHTGVGGKTDFHEDIHGSCIREVKEETGLDVLDLKLKGIIKTILDGRDYSWILFIYTANQFKGDIIDCPEGDLKWIPKDEIFSQNLIGFIKEVLPHVLDEKKFVEGTIKHDNFGNVLENNIKIINI